MRKILLRALSILLIVLGVLGLLIDLLNLRIYFTLGIVGVFVCVIVECGVQVVAGIIGIICSCDKIKRPFAFIFGLCYLAASVVLIIFENISGILDAYILLGINSVVPLMIVGALFVPCLYTVFGFLFMMEKENNGI